MVDCEKILKLFLLLTNKMPRFPNTKGNHNHQKKSFAKNGYKGIVDFLLGEENLKPMEMELRKGNQNYDEMNCEDERATPNQGMGNG